MQAIEIFNAAEVKTGAAELIEQWLNNLDVSAITKRQYSSSIKPFLSFVASNRITCRADMLRFRDGLTSAGASASAINLCLTACRSLISYLAEICPSAGASALLSMIKAAKSIKRDCASSCRQALSREQAAAVCLINSDKESSHSLRDRAIVNLMTACGLRCCEVSRADIGDLKQIGGKTCLYIQGKGRQSKDRFVVVPAAVAELIRKYLNERRHADAGDALPLFASVSNRCSGKRLSAESIGDIAKGAIRRIGLAGKAYTAHSLRHTAVTLALKAGASVREAQAMARHTSINTTAIYAHDLERFNNSAEERLYGFIFGKSSGRRLASRFRVRV